MLYKENTTLKELDRQIAAKWLKNKPSNFMQTLSRIMKAMVECKEHV